MAKRGRSRTINEIIDIYTIDNGQSLSIQFKGWPQPLLIWIIDWLRLLNIERAYNLNLRKDSKYRYKVHYRIWLSGIKAGLLHQFILGYKKGFIIDHKEHNQFDVRRQMLRHVTIAQNNENCQGKGFYKNTLSGIKGVFGPMYGNKWASVIKHNGKQYNLGTFSDKNHAAWIYRTCSKILHGEYGCLGNNTENL